MKILVGVPFFRVSELANRCLTSIVDTPATVLAIDNAADPDMKDVIGSFRGQIEVIVNQQNGFCNGGWNQVMQYGLEHDFDVIALGSSDVVMHPGWYDKIAHRAATNAKEVWIPSIQQISNDVYDPHLGLYMSFLPRKAVELIYPIPSGLRHWFGDEHMCWHLADNGWRKVLMHDVTCYHEQSAVTFRVHEAGVVIEQDKIEWQRLQLEGKYGRLRQ